EVESLASASARLPKPLEEVDTDTRAKLRGLAALDARARANPKPDNPEVAKSKAERDAFLKPFEGKPLELCWTVFGAAAREEAPGRPFLESLVGLLPTMPAPRYAEVRLLQEMLEKLPAEGWPARAVAHALR